jgi:ubiquitin-conjugating enzyme E2 Q
MNTFLVYSQSDSAPKVVHDVLARVAESSMGATVTKLISQIARELQKALIDGTSPINLEEEELPVDSESDDDDFSDYMIDEPIEWQLLHGDNAVRKIGSEAATKLNKRIRNDLRAVKDAGFHVGVLLGMKAESQTCLLSLSIEVERLELTDEAIQAWDLDRQQYAVLLIRYSAGYKSFEEVMEQAARSHEIDFRVGVSNRYKPTLSEALAAFTHGTKDRACVSGDAMVYDDSPNQSSESSAGFNSLFISSSLNKFMNSKFTSLVKVKHKFRTDWDAAKRYFNLHEGRLGVGEYASSDAPFTNKDFANHRSTESEVTTFDTVDHMEDKDSDVISFPLVAMQFFMRHLKHCTEFCLVCFDKTKDAFEALKPYVCSNPLCLFQVSDVVISGISCHRIHSYHLVTSWC